MRSKGLLFCFGVAVVALISFVLVKPLLATVVVNPTPPLTYYDLPGGTLVEDVNNKNGNVTTNVTIPAGSPGAGLHSVTETGASSPIATNARALKAVAGKPGLTAQIGVNASGGIEELRYTVPL